jgi:phage-related baseplate assembly protein
MLALSTGTNLDGLAAFWGVERLTIQEADDTVTPPILEILESDDAFRVRVQLSLEGHSTAGPRGAYVFWALSASGEVKDASVVSPAPGEVVVTVLSHVGEGTASNTLLNTINAALNDEDVRPLTDIVTVQAAEILTFQIEAVLTLYDGPDQALVIAAAQAAIEDHVLTHHRLGHDIAISGLHAALHQAGVQNVGLIQPAAHIEVDDHQAAFCTDITLSVGGRDV